MAIPVITFQIESPLVQPYSWVLQELGRWAGFKATVVEEGGEVVVAEWGMADIQVSHFFRNHYVHGDFAHEVIFSKEPLHYCANGKPDYLSTCFYMLACLQEYTDFVPDRFGRFPYARSWQERFECVAENWVARYFSLILESVPLLQEKVGLPQRRSRVLLTHDIDTLRGAYTEQRKGLLKKMRIGTLLQLMWQHYFSQSDYSRLDKILAIEDEHDARSVFFWLTEQGRSRSGIEHADYGIEEPLVRQQLDLIRSRGWENGLHKSAKRSTYAEEWEALQGHFGVFANRNHYLRLQIPNTFRQMETAGVQLDASLGFAEISGFRAGYGSAFQPFDAKTQKPFDFIEVPLLIMDTTFRYYRKQDASAAGKHIIEILDNNKANATFSILWHNNYFFDRLEPGWLQVYKDVLVWMREHQVTSVLPSQLVDA